MRGILGLMLMLLAGPAVGQVVEGAPDRTWLDFGLYAMGLRGGVSLNSDGQALGGGTLDIGSVITDRFRLRLVGELGFAPGPNTYSGSFETVYRFTPDTEMAVPYIGVGVGVAGNEACGSLPDCPAVWLQFALGFELALTDGFSWLIEYHPQDALREHRILVGLSTRRGGL